MLSRLEDMRKAEWEARTAAIVEQYERALSGKAVVKGSPVVEFFCGIARPHNIMAHEVITRAKHVGLLNEGGYYHDRADETEAFMLMLGAEVIRGEHE